MRSKFSCVFVAVISAAVVACVNDSKSRGADAPKKQPANAAAKAQPNPPAAAPANQNVGQAEQLVREALQAELDGNADVRSDKLSEALKLSPDFAPAHWQNGEVKLDGKWTAADDVAKQTARNGKIDEYRTLRDQAGKTVDDQLSLARFCNKAGLKDQEQAHLMFALLMQPDCKEALQKLDLVNYEGHLVPRTELTNFKLQMQMAFAESKDTKAQIAKLKQKYDTSKSERENVLQTIRGYRDPRAIGPLANTFGNHGEDCALAIVDALQNMPQQQATIVLVRMALYSRYYEARDAAIQALKYREVFSYTPFLLAGMKWPIEVRSNLASSFGIVSGITVVSQQGADHDESSIARNTTLITVWGSSQDNPELIPQLRRDTTNALASFAATSTQQNMQFTARAAEISNARIESQNKRIAAVLAQTTGQDYGSDAQSWWDWWYDYNEFYHPASNPLYTTETDNTYRIITHVGISCFEAGTPVLTSSGPMPIDRIHIGELVLSQNPETGELAFRPVVLTTIRPSSPVIQLQVDDDKIRVTRGHPFWVSGKGWQMAKELKPGQVLHSVKGPMLLESAKEDGEAICYNMVVAGNNDYFVGNSHLLVHDNNLRTPTFSTVPGLATK